MKTKNTLLKKSIERFDPQLVGLSISLLNQQLAYVAKTFARDAVLPRRREWRTIVFCGMGGSALGADLLRYLYEDVLRVRVVIVQGYVLPAFVDANTLVILCSYSGTTEEVASCLREVRSRHLTGFVIASGGVLMALAIRYRMPRYSFSEEYNPSRQPRIGTGYTMAAFYKILKYCKAFKPGAADLFAVSRSTPSQHRRALTMAEKTNGQSCILIAAEHLRGNAHVMSNQLNESAKVFAPYFFLSELNHHLLEGLASLSTSRRHWTVIFFDSKSYAPRMRRRISVTRHVIEKQGFKTMTLVFTGNRTVQSLTVLSFGSWWSYYLALLAKKNPSKIPWVDYFKRAL